MIKEESQKPENTLKIRLRNVIYSVDMLNGEMYNISEQIRQTEESISMLNSQIIKENSNLIELQNQLVVLYIQETKSFPPI